MKVGCAIKKINPEVGCQMEGYAPRNSTGNHDDLTVSAIAINNDFLIISMDLIALPGYRVDRIKRKIQEKFSISPEHVIMSAIHTHSGPTVTDLLIDHPEIDENYWTKVSKKTVKSVEEALINAKESTLQLLQYQVEEGIYSNRNSRTLPYNRDIYELRFLNKSKIVASYLLLATHPTVMNMKNTLISADLIGEIREEYKKVNGILPVVALSDCADTSTRFTRQESSFAEIKRLGKKIVNAFAVPIAKNEINWKLTSVEAVKQRCDYNPITNLKANELYRKIIARTKNTKDKINREIQQGLLDTYKHIRYYGHTNFETYAIIYNFEDFRIVTYPGELVYKLGELIRNHDSKLTLLITLSNDYRGYSVDEPEFGDYFESYNSVFLKGMADSFVKKIIQKL